MSWSETLLDASFRSIPMQIIEEHLQGQRALTQHGTPFQDGDRVRDLGRTARKFPMQVVAFGPNYEIELQNILRELDTPGPGELIHPIYGSLNVVTHTWDVKHSAERPDYATIDLLFIESLPDLPFFVRQFEFIDTGTVEHEDEYRWQDGVFDLFGRADSLIAEIQSWIGGGWVGLIEKALGLPGIGLRLQQMRSQILGVISGVASMAKKPMAAFDPLTDLMQTPSQIRDAIQSGTPASASALLGRAGLPASMPGKEGLTVEPATVGNALIIAVREGIAPDPAGLPGRMPDDPVIASGFGLVVLVITELALSHAQNTAQVIEQEAVKQSLGPEDVEGIVNLSRALLQTSILLHRRLYDVEAARPAIEALRDLSALIQARARQVILQRPPMIDRLIESPVSLRLLAHRWYGDHTRAIELLRLNPHLVTPHNIEAGEVLRAFAN